MMIYYYWSDGLSDDLSPRQPIYFNVESSSHGNFTLRCSKNKLEIRVVRVKIEAKVYLEKHEVGAYIPAWAASHDVCDAGSRDGYIQRALVRTK